MQTKAERAWKSLLDPWGDTYGQFLISLDAHCENLSDDDLEALAAAAAMPSQSNCGWTTYRVAPIVRDAIRSEWFRRKAAEEQSG
jgi:hypothetical protein